MKNTWLKIKLWYTGYVETEGSLSDTINPHLNMTIHPRSRLRSFVCFLAALWQNDWKWIIGTVLTIIGLIIGARML